jgi:hypothetical protein
MGIAAQLGTALVGDVRRPEVDAGSLAALRAR